MSLNDVARQFQQLATRSSSIAEEWRGLSEELTAALATVDAASLAARLELAAAYLPTLTPEALARAERLTGYRGFTRADPIRAMEREAEVLQKTIASVEADERYRRREYLVGPQGQLTRALQEARGWLDPWEQDCARFEKLEGFSELVAVGYDTPDYHVSWIHPSYWKNWSRGDRICAALGMGDFGDDVLPAFRKADAERQKWRAEVEKVAATIQELHDLLRSRNEALTRRPNLSELYLAEARAALAGHLERADDALLSEWLEREGEDRGVEMALRKVAGLKAKRAFLDEMQRAGVNPLQEQLDDRAVKLYRKGEKVLRKGVNLAGELPDGYDQKLDGLEAQVPKVRKTVQKIVDWDEYSTFDLKNDRELWWVAMTGRAPGRFTPGLRGWYERNPNAAPKLDVTSMAAGAVAMAVVHEALTPDLGDIS